MLVGHRQRLIHRPFDLAMTDQGDAYRWLDALLRQPPNAPDLPTGAEILATFQAMRPAWFAEAACRGMGPDLFFIGLGGNARPAKDVCASCPVRGSCGDYAIATDATAGIWAGQSVAHLRRRAHVQDRGDAFSDRAVGRAV
jgi:hypothetical protein